MAPSRSFPGYCAFFPERSASGKRSRREHGESSAFSGAFVFTLMTLELGLVPLPLYARNR